MVIRMILEASIDILSKVGRVPALVAMALPFAGDAAKLLTMASRKTTVRMTTTAAKTARGRFKAGMIATTMRGVYATKA